MPRGWRWTSTIFALHARHELGDLPSAKP
jgi:hypothetical protein